MSSGQGQSVTEGGDESAEIEDMEILIDNSASRKMDRDFFKKVCSCWTDGWFGCYLE